MPTCTNMHRTSQNVQGPGVCCSALAASGQTPAVGVRVAATTVKGKCIVCSKNRPVLHWKMSSPRVWKWRKKPEKRNASYSNTECRMNSTT